MCCRLIVGNIMFSLLFTLFIWHPSSSLLNHCNSSQGGHSYIQFINIIHSINNSLNSNSPGRWLLILRVSFHRWRKKEPSMEVPGRGATPGAALKLDTPAHFMIGQQGFFFPLWTMCYWFTFSNYCLLFSPFSTSLESLLMFPPTGLIIKTQHPALLAGEGKRKPERR